MTRWLMVGLTCVVTFAFAAAALRAADDDPVRVKLERAKATFQAAQEKYQANVTGWLDKREAAARQAGDKKVVDQVKAERQTFTDTGELPKTAPAALKTQFVSARSALEAAYQSAVREYTKAKKDDEATALETEMSEWQRTTVAVREVGVKIGPGVTTPFCWVPPGKATLGSPAAEKDREDYEGTAVTIDF
ncbi:hypothetical protein [Fimbriiglobus ruber]|uniref:High-affnity carbon uptake protein Hat/HatR n=1 Tax=Fimbriiglobus ruber TaxID=1908690 RepID=A0A225DPL6_9BACT|nr:hypothetical protein [Fimbriiglobus ruber]OWK38117.1 High-affnity carbon uptake protein Hat/HatR [Fimbriiglobus ruber]